MTGTLLNPPILAILRTLAKMSCPRTLLYVPALAICILAVQQLVAQTPSAGSLREGRTLLAMALGFFGRLSSVLPSPDYFDLVVELVDFVGLSNTGVHS